LGTTETPHLGTPQLVRQFLLSNSDATVRFFCFLIATAILFIRPSELIEELDKVQLYEAAMVASILTAFGVLLQQLTLTSLRERPLTACIVGLLIAMIASHLVRGATFEARQAGILFGKIVIFYLLVVTNLDTSRRFRWYLFAVIVLMSIQVGLGLCQYFGLIQIEALASFAQREYDPTTGEMKVIPRLCGCGIFHDPNDLCVLLAVSSVFCVYLITEKRLGLIRFLVLIPLSVFVYSIPLTHSRGGLLALIGCVCSLLVSLLGLRRGTLLLLVALPLLLVGIGGRQTRFDLDDSNDTSQHRMRLWSDGLVLLRSSPIFGIGQGNYAEHAGLTAHNTYVESFTELGFFGGTCFVSLFLYSLGSLRRLPQQHGWDRLGSLAHFRPFAIAAVLGLGIGLVSLSRLYTPSTYLLFGIVAAYLRLVSYEVPSGLPPLTIRLMSRLLFAGLLTVVGFQLFIMAFVRWS
jgi:putative inorganic carbon (hco3(-)) transporter